jgi:hypothetical protein
MAKKVIKKAQYGKEVSKSLKDPAVRTKSYEKAGWKKDNPTAIKRGYAPSDTVNTQWMSKGKDIIGINKKKSGGTVKSKKK